MARHRPKERKYDEDDDESTTPSPEEHPTLSALVSSRITTTTPPISSNGPPRDDDEAKRIFYRDLVRLKEQRYSHKVCADLLQVSERSIVNYMADPLYKEIQQEMIADAKQRGHLLISETIDVALGTLYELMQPNGKVSPFVRFKAAEAMLNYAGYNLPREEAHQDAREGLSKFLEEVEKRRNGTTVNIHISSSEKKEESTTWGEDGQGVIDGSIEYQQGKKDGMEVYRQQVLPGGKLPPLPFGIVPPAKPDGTTTECSEKMD